MTITDIDISNFKAIIWDMDGVIVDSETLWPQKEPAWIAKKFPKFQKSRCDEFMGQSAKGVFNILQTVYPKLIWEDFKDELEQLALKEIYPSANIFSGVRQALERFSKTHQQAIASSALKSWIETVVTRHNLSPYFEAIISSEDVMGASKPNPKIFIHTAQHLGLHPHQCLVLEDSQNGITAGKKAGMTVGVFLSDSNKNRDLKGGDFYFNDFNCLYCHVNK